MKYLLIILFSLLSFNSAFSEENFDNFLFKNSKLIINSSSKTVGTFLEKINVYDQNTVSRFLNLWKNKKLFYIKETKKIVLISKFDNKTYYAIDIFSNAKIGKKKKKDFKKIKPNSGVRAKIATALVNFQIFSNDKNKRINSINALEKKILPEHLKLLRKAFLLEEDDRLKIKIKKLLQFAILQHGTDDKEKIKVLNELKTNTSIEVRAVLSKLLRTSEIKVTRNIEDLNNLNIAQIIKPEVISKKQFGEVIKSFFYKENLKLSVIDAYKIAQKNGFLDKRVSLNELKLILENNIVDNKILGIDIKEFNENSKRIEVYNKLAKIKNLNIYRDETELLNDLKQLHFYKIYIEKNKYITNKTKQVLDSINFKVKFYKYLDLFIDGLSLSSIYFLGAIGLAITFGVMRVINMAHGEFIMMGAYTGYVVQSYITNHTLSLIIAFPLAFIITFIAGVIMERLVIKHLYKNPLDTLLATFGISIALQQLAKNIFGTQARPLTSPSWLDGSLIINDDLSISYIRIAIFVLGVLFFLILLFVMKKTRFGLETRSVTQNPVMASNMGVNTEKINMLTFGFGSGIAGVAGVAIGLFSKVTSELGSEYIVQSFMTVVVGGVGSIWGTLAGASLIGFLQKFIEWFNPSNTLAAQTYMIIFIILFIQFRPRGLIALKGRAANDN
jgi:urea transport system permease protein|tara:strand:- start:3814 stop:5826 length:2013 start_codon:yes stop_codon:yes gene_type:complete